MNVLYVDDIRQPRGPYSFSHIAIVRSYDDALKKMVTERFDAIDLDHDLGEDKTGYDIAKFIVEKGFNFQTIYIHTANPVGRQNMIDLLQKHTRSRIVVYL